MKRMMLMTMCIVVLAGFGTTRAGLADYDAYWQFENNDNDSSANSYNLYCDNALTWSYKTGVVGKSRYFMKGEGSPNDTAYRDINQTQKIRDVGNQFTLAFWVVSGMEDGWGTGDVFNYFSPTNNSRSILATAMGTSWNPEANRKQAIQFYLYDDSQQNYDAGRVYFVKSSNWDDANTWYHIVWVVNLDGSGGGIDSTIYCTPYNASTVSVGDSKDLAITDIHNYSGPDGQVELALGSSQDDFTQNEFYGRLDEMVFYNRALSQSEVQQLFDIGKAGQPIPEPATAGLLSLGLGFLVRRK